MVPSSTKIVRWYLPDECTLFYSLWFILVVKYSSLKYPQICRNRTGYVSRVLSQLCVEHYLREKCTIFNDFLWIIIAIIVKYPQIYKLI